MAIIALPPKFSFTRLPLMKLQRATNMLVGKYNAGSQIVVYPYAVWTIEGTLVEYDGLDAGRIRRFLAELDGQKNTFRLPVPGFTKPMTGFAGNGLVNQVGGVAARAMSMPIDGLGANNVVVAEGDYFTIQDELKIVTEAGASDAGGRLTIKFKPGLRKAAADNTPVTFQNPTCLMRAASDDVAKWAVAPPVRQATSLAAVEAIEL